MSGPVLVGLISDTHGLVDPRVHEALCGVVAIIHAGDIGSDATLYELGVIAPVTAALGNCDGPALAAFDVQLQVRTKVAGVRILAIHDIHDLGPIPSDVDVVVHGHTHMPSIQYHGRVLVVNPGSASHPRLVPGPSVGILEIGDGRLEARIVMLDDLAE